MSRLHALEHLIYAAYADATWSLADAAEAPRWPKGRPALRDADVHG